MSSVSETTHNQLGLPTSIIYAIINVIYALWDAVNDPFVGYLSDNTISGQGMYEIKARVHLNEKWTFWFEGLKITTSFDGENKPITTFSGPIEDRSALHGVLAKIRDINMLLISVNQI